MTVLIRVAVLAGLAASAGAHAQSCGILWRQLTPTLSPPVRYYHAMAGDAARGRVVVFGGQGSTPFLGDTWEWDGTAGGVGAWTLRSMTGPSRRAWHAMTYDSARQRVVLFGGGGSNGFVGDTWEWDGAAWLQRSNTGPAARGRAGMAYDAARQRTVLFGGASSSGPLGDTWEWDGDAGVWSQRSPEHSPPVYPFSGPGLVYDPNSYGVIAVTSSYQTWLWDGQDWSQIPGAAPPGAPGILDFDPVRQRAVMYSGRNMWEWNNAAWSQRASAGPEYREGLALAFDSARGHVIALTESYMGTAETWEWVGDDTAGPTLTQWPQPLSVKPGTFATFTVAATSSGALSYQWYRGSTLLVEGGPYSGVQTPTLTIHATSVGHGGGYSVVVTDPCGSITSPAYLNVICYPNCDRTTNFPYLNVDDFVCFQAAFASGQSYANCDNSTTPPVLNINDFLCFQAAFVAGCP
jgi:hypothetical protein